MAGTINRISVAGMLRIVCAYGKNGFFGVESRGGEGYIELQAGSIVEAGKDNKPDMDTRSCVIRILSGAAGGTFYFEEGVLNSKKPAGIDVEDVILESSRAFCEQEPELIADYIVPDNEVLRISRLPDGRKIRATFNPDEWNLMVCFNGDVNVKGAMENSGVEPNRARAALYGLTSAGILKRARFKIPEIGKIAMENLGNIGLAIVDAEMQKLRIDTGRMGMKDFLELLNALEKSFADITGKSRATAVVEKIWNATK